MDQQTLLRLAKSTSNKVFELILLPTESCNYRCAYCYEDFALGRMPNAVVEAVKGFLSRRIASAENATLSWFGGEPLLAKDIVLEISRHMMECARCKPGMKYTGMMTTNGFALTPTTLDELAAVGVMRYQISLDGPRDLHNLTRRRNHGEEGTFDTIWKNLLGIRDSGLPVSVLLRVHFDALSHRYLDPLIEDIRRELLPSNRFRVFFREVSRLGGKNDADIRVLTEAEKQTVLDRLYGQLGAPPYQDELRDCICYASRANSLVIRADGTLAKCTVAFKDARNRIGQLNPDGTLQIRQDRLSLWLRGLRKMDNEILACPLRGLPPMDN